MFAVVELAAAHYVNFSLKEHFVVLRKKFNIQNLILYIHKVTMQTQIYYICFP